MSASNDTSLAFDDLVIDFAGRRLLRAGQPVALEPKAFDVLALLARSSGTALTRDQILDAVWGHRHVTPGVLNRIMTLLRHALGEEANAPRYLHTLHGVGYRFDLPEVTSSPVVPELAAEAQPESIRRESDRIKPRPSWPNYVIAGLLAGMAMVAAVGWMTREVAKPTPARVAAASASTRRPPTLIVMPLKPISRDGSTPEIAAGLSEQLIGELSRIAGLRVIARESTSLAAADKSSIAELVPRLQITHALEGSLQQSGEAMRVNIRLTEAVSGRTLWAQDFDREAADALTLQRDIAKAVAKSLTLKLSLSPTPRSGDVEFLRRYFAVASTMGLTSGRASSDHVEQVESEFRELVHMRPDDARTHSGLAAALESRAFQRPVLAESLRQEAAREAAIALSIDPAQAEALGVQATAACRAEHWERCFELYGEAIDIEPNKSWLRYRQAFALASLGYLHRAREIIKTGIEHDPINPRWRFGHARVLDTMGKHDEALAEYQKAGDTISPYGLWFNAVWRGDFRQAALLAEAMDQPSNSGLYERVLKPAYVAVSAALIDPRKWPEAEAAMARTEQETGLMNFSRVLKPGADPATMLEGLTTARQRSYSTWDLLVWTRDLDFLRRGPAFEKYIRDTGILAYWRKHGFPEQCKPRGESVDCS